MKDFYDIWLITQQFTLDQEELFTIVKKVLKRRDTDIDDIPKAFTEAFYSNPSKIEKWKSFLKDISHEDVPLEKVVLDLKKQFEGLFFKV